MFQWALEWTRNLASGDVADVGRYKAFLEHLVTSGFAADRQSLRAEKGEA